mmetsp:Transcript_5001/g.11824  ORF Transcript_5001/g.11824 Transcript_5001/m.11824 type:complete len:251 (+) Transcript_5001:777-1529(+)
MVSGERCKRSAASNLERHIASSPFTLTTESPLSRPSVSWVVYPTNRSVPTQRFSLSPTLGWSSIVDRTIPAPKLSNCLIVSFISVPLTSLVYLSPRLFRTSDTVPLPALRLSVGVSSLSKQIASCCKFFALPVQSTKFSVRMSRVRAIRLQSELISAERDLTSLPDRTVAIQDCEKLRDDIRERAISDKPRFLRRELAFGPHISNEQELSFLFRCSQPFHPWNAGRRVIRTTDVEGRNAPHGTSDASMNE